MLKKNNDDDDIFQKVDTMSSSECEHYKVSLDLSMTRAGMPRAKEKGKIRQATINNIVMDQESGCHLTRYLGYHLSGYVG